jgi:hypothetical protein
LSERAGEPALAGAGFPGDQEVLPSGDPVAGGELGEQRLVEAAGRLGVEILDGGVLPEIGKFEPGDEAFGLALDGLAIDQEAEPLLEGERRDSALLALLFEGFGHAGKTKGDQPVVGGMGQHVGFPVIVFFTRGFLFAHRRLRAFRGTRSSGIGFRVRPEEV